MQGKKGFLFFVVILLFILTGCQPAMEPLPAPESPAVEINTPGEKTDSESQALLTPQSTSSPIIEEPVAEEPEKPITETTQIPVPTMGNATKPTLVPEQTPEGIVNQTIILDQRFIEFEYPQQLFFGDSDVIRLSLIPNVDGYIVQSEFPDHKIESKPIQIDQIEGYQLIGIAEIFSIGFNITPDAAQEKIILDNQDTHWRWTISAETPGVHRLTISLAFQWKSVDETDISRKTKVEVFSKAFEVNVHSFFGLNRKQSFVGGFGSLILSGVLGFITLFLKKDPIWKLLEEKIPDKKMKIETKPEIKLEYKDISILQGMFSGYDRILIEREFLSGYSGARTLLILPVHLDGRRDAETIVKIGTKENILREYQNYLTYVKHTLPPMTARIQQPPISVKNALFAAIMYTFVAEPGKPPKSLRNYIRERQNPGILDQLFVNFGPNWWYQNSPYVYRLSQEFDKKLPSHLSVIPVDEKRQPSTISFNQTDYDLLASIYVGQTIFFETFDHFERRSDGKSFTLIGKSTGSNAPIRVRWLNEEKPRAGMVRVVHTRESTYHEYQKDFQRFGLPDPWDFLKKVIHESVEGTRSVIHGDLNLENILIGAGGFVWLIDFSETREGPPIFDLSHLAVEFVAHHYANGKLEVGDFLISLENKTLDYLNTLEKLAERCVKPGSGLKEYHLALLVSSMGALKYENLSRKSKHFLYLFAAYEANQLIKEFQNNITI